MVFILGHLYCVILSVPTFRKNVLKLGGGTQNKNEQHIKQHMKTDSLTQESCAYQKHTSENG